MPNVGLTTFTEPLEESAQVSIRYVVEVEGLPVYTELYDVKKIAEELKTSEDEVIRNWIRRIKCVAGCRSRPGFSSCVTRCLAEGKCCDLGATRCKSVD